ncbi:MAG: hypothetical protein KA821_03335 [Chitinophagaceae bacterium]|nr:hypothetical protein [Chitinophagaceae bacterium]
MLHLFRFVTFSVFVNLPYPKGPFILFSTSLTLVRFKVCIFYSSQFNYTFANIGITGISLRPQSFTTFGIEMRAVFFFVYLCLLTLAGTQPAHATERSVMPGYTQHSFTKKLHWTNFNHAPADLATIRSRNIDTEKEYFFTDGVEEEDTIDLSARKFRLLARSLTVLQALFFVPVLQQRLSCTSGNTGLYADICIKHCILRV